jgi:hypothetical protein
MGFENSQTLEGSPPPADTFQPYRPGVELLPDMDEFFESTRRIVELGECPGEFPGDQIPKGQCAVAIVTPGRLIMFDRCPAPGSIDEGIVAPMRELMPQEPPLKISVVSRGF